MCGIGNKLFSDEKMTKNSSSYRLGIKDFFADKYFTGSLAALKGRIYICGAFICLIFSFNDGIKTSDLVIQSVNSHQLNFGSAMISGSR